jgi:hypothetical protein
MSSPFIGLIISTFDSKEESFEAKHQWFHVAEVADRRTTANKTVSIPMVLEVELMKLKSNIESDKFETLHPEHFNTFMKELKDLSETDIIIEVPSVVIVDEDETKLNFEASQSEHGGETSIGNQEAIVIETKLSDESCEEKVLAITSLICALCHNAANCLCCEVAVDRGEQNQGSSSSQSQDDDTNGGKHKMTLEEEYKKYQDIAIKELYVETNLRPSRAVKKREFYNDSHFEAIKKQKLIEGKLERERKTKSQESEMIQKSPSLKFETVESIETPVKFRAEGSHLLELLIDLSSEVGEIARSLILNCRPSTICLLLNVVSVVIYYRESDRRIKLEKKWKCILAIEKIEHSLRERISRFSFPTEEENELVSSIIRFLRVAWTSK